MVFFQIEKPGSISDPLSRQMMEVVQVFTFGRITSLLIDSPLCSEDLCATWPRSYLTKPTRAVQLYHKNSYEFVIVFNIYETKVCD